MRHSPETPFELFGYEIGAGWMPLVKPIIDKIDELNQSGAQITLTQVKSKFGELRVYIQNENEELQRLIQEACDKSRHICEYCGRHAEQTTINGWIYTLCPDCMNSHKKRDRKESLHI